MADLVWSSLWKVGFSEKFGFTNYKLRKTNKHGIVIDVLFNNKPSEITTFYRTTPKKESLGMTTVFNCAGVDKKEFEKYTESHPATYDDWSRTWQQETTGKSRFKGQ